MNIAIDISQIVYDTGVSVYTKNLLENILKFDKINHYIIFGGSLRRREALFSYIKSLSSKNTKHNIKSVIKPLPPMIADIIWNRLHIIKIEKLVGKIDIFHSSDWTQPPSDAYKITTIHDLIPIKYPKLSTPKIVSVHNARFRHVKKEVDKIIVPSQSTKIDLLELGIKEEKIVVIPEAPDPIYKPAKQKLIDELKQKFRIPDKYLLAVGTTPRKNLERIIEAFKRIRSNNLKLVIIGECKTKTFQCRGIIYTGHVRRNLMPILYTGAQVLIYPSLYEGFGLPILEAFACKTPVVTSNFGSMVEVTGSASVLVDPYRIDSITDGIKKAIKNKKSLVKKGIAQAKKYTWERTAKITLGVYEKLPYS